MNAPRKTTRLQADRGDGPSRGPGWLAGMVIALLTARFLLPTEASVDGETLWLVQLWILAAAVWGWRQFLRGRPWIHWDLGTLAVALLVAGHLVSGFVLFSRGGDKRAAVNLMWEWVSLGITFVIVRSVFAEAGGRRAVIWALACVGVSLAGLGLHQHLVQFPRLAEEYREKRAELDRLLESGSRQFARRTRVQELRRWFMEREIPLEGPQRKQWEARALSSSEPFATFGLANTLAGVLVVFLFPAAALVMAELRENKRRSLLSLLAPACVALILLACLVLTKSRTAWIGGIAGGVVWWWAGRHEGGKRKAESGKSRSIRLPPSAFRLVALVIAVVAAAAAVTGRLDREVLSESPKSLRYRWQYWTGTAAMLEELPWFGPGPGNFRQRYLKHKLPESSEEISDPHNLFLDVWSNGGVIALAGLVLLLAWSARQVWRSRGEANPEIRGQRSEIGKPQTSADHRPPTSDLCFRPGLAGITAGSLLVILYVWFLGEGNVPRLWALLAGSAAAWLLTWRNLRTAGFSTACLAGAATALAVHLLGAGGMEMPAIAGLLLVLCAAVVKPEVGGQRSEAGGRISEEIQIPSDLRPPTSGFPLSAFRFPLLVTAVAAVLFGTCLSTATIPVLTRQAAMSKGRQQMQQRDPRDAERHFRSASVNDPLSPAPVRKLAELAHLRWQKSRQEEWRLKQAIGLQRVAIGLDPDHYAGYWNLGQWLALKHEIGRDADDAAAALEAYAQAVELYPHNARLLADYAAVLQQTGRDAAAVEVGQRALELDDLYHREGHADKYLPEEIRQRLLAMQRKKQRASAPGVRN